MRTFALALAVWLGSAALAFAEAEGEQQSGNPQPLLSLLPQDTLLYFTMDQTPETVEAAKKTVLAQLMREPSVKQFQEEVQALQRSMPGPGSFLGQMAAANAAGAHEPLTGRLELAVTPPQAGALPLPSLMVAAQPTGGITAGQLQSGLDTVCAMAGMFADLQREALQLGQQQAVTYGVQGVPLKLVTFIHDKTLYATIGRAQAEAMLRGLKQQPATSLRDSKVFTAITEQLGSHQSLGLTYVNLRKIRQIALAFIPAPQARNVVNKLGLDGLVAMGSTSWIDGDVYQARSFIMTDGSTHGILSLLQLDPLTPEDAVDLPPNTVLGAVVGMDLPGIYKAGRDAALELGVPRQQYDAVLMAIEQQLGVHVEKDLLPALGKRVSFSVAVAPFQIIPDVHLGIGVSSKPALQEILGSVRQAYQRATNGGCSREQYERMQRRRPVEAIVTALLDEEMGARREMPDGTVIRFAMLERLPISPAYAITEDRLFISLTSTGLERVLRSRANDKTLMDQADVRRERHRLPAKAGALCVVDLPRMFSIGMNLAEPFLAMAVAHAEDESGVNLQPLLAAKPATDVIARHLRPVVSTAWSVENGLVSQSTTLLDPSSGLLTGVAAAGVTAGIALPAISRARQSANRVASASNLKQIGMAIAQYELDYAKYPEKLSDLYPEYLGSLRVFASPRNDNPGPRSKQEIDEKSHYVYISGLKPTDGTDTVVLYEKPVDGKGTNVVFAGDYHNEWVSLGRLSKMLREQHGKEMETAQGVTRITTHPPVRVMPEPVSEVVAIGALREIANQQQLHHNKYRTYGTLKQLARRGLDDAILAATDPEHPFGGYTFVEYPSPDRRLKWCVAARPPEGSEKQSFICNQTGRMWMNSKGEVPEKFMTTSELNNHPDWVRPRY